MYFFYISVHLSVFFAVSIREFKKHTVPMQSTAVEPVTHYVTLEASANALAVSRDASQVVVAGRNGMCYVFFHL